MYDRLARPRRDARYTGRIAPSSLVKQVTAPYHIVKAEQITIKTSLDQLLSILTSSTSSFPSSPARQHSAYYQSTLSARVLVLIKYVRSQVFFFGTIHDLQASPLALLRTNFRSQKQPLNMKTTVLYAITSFGTSVLAAPGLATKPLAAPAQTLQARSGEYLGGINMDSACRAQYGPDWRAVSRGNTCSDWSCNIGDSYKSVDTPQACRIQYGLGNYAYCSAGVYSWGCYSS